MSSLNGLLAGKVGLVAGIANERSIAAALDDPA
jgi:enoyl-[acyl-carrier-protein] reductase (NADH)